MKRQTGFTLSGLIFFLLLLVLALYTAMRIAPIYVDYWVVNRALSDLAAQPNLQDSDDDSIRTLFGKQLSLNNVTRVTRSDLLIERLPGRVKLSTAITAKRPFLGPISLCLDFQAEANAKSTAGN